MEEHTLIELLFDANHIFQEVFYEVVKFAILFPIAKFFWKKHHDKHHKGDK
jgi:hypothetical protein